MKIDQSKYDAEGQLKNGIFMKFFKDGALLCDGTNRDNRSHLSAPEKSALSIYDCI